jgi:hypothetical protein
MVSGPIIHKSSLTLVGFTKTPQLHCETCREVITKRDHISLKDWRGICRSFFIQHPPEEIIKKYTGKPLEPKDAVRLFFGEEHVKDYQATIDVKKLLMLLRLNY